MSDSSRWLGGISLVTLCLVAGCAARAPLPSLGDPSVGRALPTNSIPRPEPRSRYGNGPIYEVYGQRYTVLDSSYGYVERGVASWYGRKFHGRPTSSREPYDMHGMTAAHKSLPLPTWVEVTNLANGRRIVVRVNDRGPFVKNRLIDLSYAAAERLDIVENGTGMVEVRAISFDDPPPAAATPVPATVEVATATGSPADSGPAFETVTPRATAVATPDSAAAAGAQRLFVQVGAFGDRANAERRHRLLAANGIRTAFVHRETDRQPALYRVRVGPLADVAHYDRVIDELSRIGITSTHLVSE